jgi:hypothetical protein
VNQTTTWSAGLRTLRILRVHRHCCVSQFTPCRPFTRPVSGTAYVAKRVFHSHSLRNSLDSPFCTGALGRYAAFLRRIPDLTGRELSAVVPQRRCA